MSRTSFIILMAVIALVFFVGMWIAWRGRTKRDSGAVVTGAPLVGEELASFPRASYVSTTPLGAPFERLALPGLRYKGFAELIVRRDGVSIAVTGEAPVLIPSAQLLGSGTAAVRAGKAVDRDALSLVQWRTAPQDGSAAREVESSFLLADPAAQHRFAVAIAEARSQTNTTHPTIQEEA
ncbi:hypothetical protein [Leucobacter luti]|uniref:PH domain-containing protein n=1 Tax=Leucobacter luti TaxID=340320 RepID=A0A4R6RUW0_9MICO|nr:hypothetical protein [Leucobacter luti]QYM76094.1 hypothetical protein K1X41_00960 [Leucobacter luti]TDP90177.1 hypothetical protein EDF62_2744 [Leucobacter luti]